MNTRKKIIQIAERYRHGQLTDTELDAIAPIQTGLDAEIIRQIARRLDDKKLEETLWQ